MSFWINAAIWAVIVGVGIWKSKPKPLTIAFVVSLYIGLETYLYVSDWLSYLPTKLHVLFYVIPLAVFLLSSIVYCKKEKIAWEEALSTSRCWYICLIIAVCLTFPTIFVLYDWHEARMEYESKMEKLFGEDWENEVDELKAEESIR